MQLQKRALRLDKILLGYQGHLGNEDTVVNPKDKYTIKTWDAIGKWHKWCGRRGVGCDVCWWFCLGLCSCLAVFFVFVFCFYADIVYMEGHSELHETEEDKAEIVLEAFQHVAHKSMPESFDKKTVSQKLMASLKSKKMDVRPELDGGGGGGGGGNGEGKQQHSTGRSLLVTGETDSKVLELLIAMNAKMVNLQEKVDDMQCKLNNIDAGAVHASTSTTSSTV
jgi:hypothetical protein